MDVARNCPILCNNNFTGAKSAPVWDGVPRMSEVNLPEDQDHLLCPRWVPGAQGGRAAQHLLPLQRLHGGPSRGDGRGYPRWVSSSHQALNKYLVYGVGLVDTWLVDKWNLKTFSSDFFSFSPQQIVFWVWNPWQVDLLCIKSSSCRCMSLRQILMIFSFHNIWRYFHVMQKDIDDIFFVPRPPSEAAPVFGKKVGISRQLAGDKLPFWERSQPI